MTNRAPRAGEPGTCEVRAPNQTIVNLANNFDRTRCGALLITHLDDTIVSMLPFRQQLPFACIVAARFLDINVLSSLQC